MNKRYGYVAKTFLLVAMLLLNICLLNVSPVYAQEISRGDIIWGAGYWPGLTNFNPVRMDEGMGWDTYISYEPVFGTDVASDVLGPDKIPNTGDEPALIRWLGNSIKWLDPTTIEIKLRSGIYWVKIADWDGWLAETYTPEKYRDINASDVVFSWYLEGAFPESPAPAGYLSGVRSRVDTSYSTTIAGITMSGVTIEDPTTIKVHLSSPYANSAIVWRALTRSYLMVPYDIWLQIDPDPAVPNAEGQYEYFEFTNDWTKPDYPVLRVASGMYLPWKHIQVAVDRWQTIMKRNDNWWGIKVFGRQPAPKYMGYHVGYPNEEIEVMIKDGMIDWDGSYVPGKETWPEFLNTYFKDAPYFPDKSALLMVPNYFKWPICEGWLHWALAYVMDYSANSAASSGYCVDGSKYHIYGTEIQYPNAFLIPKDDAIANIYLKNYPNRDKYLVGDKFHTADDAIALLAKNCYYIVGGNIVEGLSNIKANMPNGDWYTKGDNKTAIKAWLQNIYNYYSAHPWIGPLWSTANEIPIVIGVVKHTLGEWLTDFDTLIETADQLPAIPGINVKLGYSDYPRVGDPWTIIDIRGWTDVCEIDKIAAKTINDVLDIPFDVRFITWDEYQGWTSGEGQTHVYDFMDYCMHWGINGDLYERYMQLFSCWTGVWNHYSGYASAQLEDLIESLDTAPDPQTVANQIFDIIGNDLPYIPIAGHPDWYIYSTQYWTRWPNEKHAFLPASPYGGASQDTNVQFILLALGSVARPEDINNDHIVNIKDIFVAAKAFGSYPGHVRWDFAADINGDGQVNIKDIHSMARAFGKTW